MSFFDEIQAARKTLGLFEKASVSELEKKKKQLLFKWHPDRNQDNIEKANEMTSKILDSYNLIIKYFMNYKIPFSREDVMKYCTPEEWWHDKFGTDPLWSNHRKDD